MTSAPTDTPSARPTVAVVGAGICGLGIGWRLAAAGCAVDVFDRAEAGREASWAAAGMLAAQVETEPGEEALLALNLESQVAWPAFATELEAESNIDLGYRDERTLVVAAHRDDAAILGPTPVDGLVVATGHHRNGVLLAPLTIDAVSAFMLEGMLPDSIESFGIGRFAAAAMPVANAGSQK